MSRDKIKDCSVEIIKVARRLRAGLYLHLDREAEHLRRLVTLLEYQHRPGKIDPELPADAHKVLQALRCSHEGCHNPPPYWNIAFNQKGLDWRCLDHLPDAKEITFPVSLWGEDYLTTKRPCQLFE